MAQRSWIEITNRRDIGANLNAPAGDKLIELFPQLGVSVRPLLPGAEPQVGTSYREADEDAAVGQRDPFEVDPSLVERALRGHAATQNALAAHVRGRGSDPLSPAPADPNYDLAWRDAGTVYVAEVKSRTDQNEERQLRLGLGQVLRYRDILARASGGHVCGCARP